MSVPSIPVNLTEVAYVWEDLIEDLKDKKRTLDKFRAMYDTKVADERENAIAYVRSILQGHYDMCQHRLISSAVTSLAPVAPNNTKETKKCKSKKSKAKKTKKNKR